MLGTRTPRGHDRRGPVKIQHPKNNEEAHLTFFNLNPKFWVRVEKITLSPHVKPPQSKMLGTRTPRGTRRGEIRRNPNPKIKGRAAPYFSTST
jgi:hypothetical protein